MDAVELLRRWPGWANANAGKILSSPAWRMPVECDGRPAVIRRRAAEGVDFLWIEVAFEGEPHRIGIADSPAFGDLHLLWAKRGGLPPEIVLALIERECGALLQTVEDVFRRGLEIGGIAEGPGNGPSTAFAVEPEGTEPVAFAIDLSPTLTMELGKIDYIDTDHPSVTGMTLAAEAEFAEIRLTAAEIAVLAPGDALLLGETDAARWRTALDAADPSLCRAVDAAKGELSFAMLVSGTLPPVPPPGEGMRLVRGDSVLASGAAGRVGTARAFVIGKAGE